MNRRRNETRTPISTFIALFLAAAIAAVGGVLHAYYKNRQVQIAREIDAIERRVDQYRFDIRTTQMRSDQLLNRFVIRKQIEANGSSLKPIPLSSIEEINTSESNNQAVASIP